MIPYYKFDVLFTIPVINLGVHIFGALVVLGIFVGTNIAYWKAKHMNVEKEKLSAMITFILVVGFISAHLFDNLAYRFDEVLKNPLMLLELWAGISSFGGIIGAFLGVIYYTKKHNMKFLEYGETIAFGLPFGWFFGRLGCASVHDHIGAKTDFFLGINFPDIGIRHDLGLEEAIFLFLFSILFFFLRNKHQPTGFFLMLLCLLYSPVRFFLDSLRAVDIDGADTRYFGLTPAQYSSIALFIAGLYLLNKLYNKPTSKPILKTE